MSLHVTSTHFWAECNIDKWWILKWCSYFWGQLTRIAVSRRWGAFPLGVSGSQVPPQIRVSLTPSGTAKNYLCFCSLNHCQKERRLALAHCLLPCHWPSQRQDRTVPFPVLWHWGEPCETAQKRGLFSTTWKKPPIPCACPLCPSELSEDVCVGIAGLLPSVFCGSALLLFSFWQTGTAWALLLFWSGPAFLFSGLLVCFLGIDRLPNPQNCIFHEYLSIPKCGVSMFRM